jgi:hypothetical protein
MSRDGLARRGARLGRGRVKRRKICVSLVHSSQSGHDERDLRLSAAKRKSPHVLTAGKPAAS